MKKNEPTLDDILGLNDEPKVKPKTKTKPVVQPKKLGGEAKDVLETQFVTAYLKYGNNTDAYFALYPDTHKANAKNLGNKFRKRKGVIHALREIREQATTEAMKYAGFTIEKAFDIIEGRIQRATDAEQHSAVASLSKLQLEMSNHINSKVPAGAGSSVNFIIEKYEKPQIVTVEQNGETISQQITEGTNNE